MGVISLICTSIVIYIKKKKSNTQIKPILKVLIALACGALIGDAFVHLIPHAFTPHEHEKE